MCGAVIVHAAHTIESDRAATSGADARARCVTHHIHTNGVVVSHQIIPVGTLPTFTLDRNIAASRIERGSLKEHAFVFGLAHIGRHVRCGRTHSVVGAVQSTAQGDVAAAAEQAHAIQVN